MSWVLVLPLAVALWWLHDIRRILRRPHPDLTRKLGEVSDTVNYLMAAPTDKVDVKKSVLAKNWVRPMGGA